MVNAVGPDSEIQSRVRRSLVAIRRRWVPLLLVFASLLMGFTVTAHHSDALSPVDEWVYADYLYKLPQQLVVPRGQEIGPQALAIMACSGVREYGTMGPPCNSDYQKHLAKFPQHGITSADGYTPLFFWATWVGAKVIQLFTRTSIVEAARYFGAFWLAGGILLFYWLLRLLKVNRIVALGLGLAVIASPFAWWTYTFISTDAPSFAFGALLLVAAIKFTRAQWSGWWIVLISVVATLFKTTNILAVLLVALYLILEYILRRTRERPRRRGFSWRTCLTGRGDDSFTVVAVVAIAASAVAELIWLVIRNAIALGPPATQGYSGSLSLEALGEQLVNFLPGTIISNVNIYGRTQLGLPIPPWALEPLSWICVAGVVGALLLFRWRQPNATLVYAIAVAAVIAAPILTIALTLQGTYFVIPPRYGACLLPAFLLAVGLIVRSRFGKILLVAYPTALLGVILVFAPTLA